MLATRHDKIRQDNANRFHSNPFDSTRISSTRRMPTTTRRQRNTAMPRIGLVLFLFLAALSILPSVLVSGNPAAMMTRTPEQRRRSATPSDWPESWTGHVGLHRDFSTKSSGTSIRSSTSLWTPVATAFEHSRPAARSGKTSTG